MNMRHISWFSCGAASACASKIAVDTLDNVVVAYCDTSLSEHEDNLRFIADCENWIGQPITRLRNEKYSTVEEVFEAKKFMSGISGACCTAQLKKLPRIDFSLPNDVHIFGFTQDEQKRIDDFESRNPDLRLRWVLRDNGKTKQDCYGMILAAGIELPEMYKLGFRNNNCIGCVKATSPGYWSKVKDHFPETFRKRAEQSRQIGCRLVRVDGQRIFLDEMPDRYFPYHNENISCGPECGQEQLELFT